MALGFGFNKAKVLASAEKFVQQGKLQNAIAEYEKVIREDPKEFTLLNTIGDLYARLGQTDNAVKYFKRVGDHYASEGFNVKAIAMYKKLTKLAAGNTECILRLAELYTQQGLYNDAKQQYMVIADYYLKGGDLDSTARMFQKMLELDPESTAMQAKMADLYLRMGKKEDAKEIYFRAAESLYQRTALDAADDAAAKVLNIESGNTRALTLRARIALESGHPQNAVEFLQRIPNIDSRPEGLNTMLQAQLAASRWDEAEPLARKLLTVHSDPAGINAYAQALLTHGESERALKIYNEFADRLLAGNPAGLADQLHPLISRVKDNAAALDALRELFTKAGDRSHITEVTELLAHALVQADDLPRARDLYKELAQVEPENPAHEQNYRQVMARLGEDAASRTLSTAEAGQAFMVDELSLGGPQLDQVYPAEVDQAIKSALTDSELISSYSTPVRAIAPIEKVLPQAPHDERLNQRLASLYAEVGRFADAAGCCGLLADLYRAAGHAEQGAKYRDMAAHYRERAGAAPAPAKAAPEPAAPTPRAVTPSPAPPAQPVVEAKVAAPSAAPSEEEPAAAEIDLSAEWESQAEVEPPAAPPAPDFSIEVPTPEIEEVAAKPPSGPKPVAPEFSIEGVPQEPESAPEIPPALTPPTTPTPAGAAAVSDVLGDFVADLEESLPNDFAAAAPPTVQAAAASAAGAASGKPPAPVAAASAAPPPVAPAPPAVRARPAAASTDAAAAHDMLADIFDEFKEEAEGGAEQAEDPETHYNLGVAFREMGLLDEAIGELQKVCHAVDQGASFRDIMQAYTWLAQCFVDKGVPEASVQWYEKALKAAPDNDTRNAVHYDLASALEAAGNRPAALKHFLEVYGSNIDYRDVADRIKALRS